MCNSDVFANLVRTLLQVWVQTWCAQCCHLEHTLADNFDEKPCAFRQILPSRAHALITHCSVSDVEFSMHSDEAFDEHPYAVLRILNQHWNVILPSWDVQN